jgi:pilus assembly protein CpaC
MRLPRATKGTLTVCILTLFLICSGISWAGIPTQVVVNKSVLLKLYNPDNPIERISYPKSAEKKISDILLINPYLIKIDGVTIGSTSLIVWRKGIKDAVFYDINVVGDTSQLDPMIKEMAPNDAITVDIARDTVVLSGKARNQQTVEKVVQLAKAYAPNVLNHIRIDEPQQVILQVKVAQVDKTSLRKLGIQGLMKGKTGEGFYNLIAPPSGGATASATNTTPGSGTGISGNVPGLGSYNPLDAFTAGVSYFPAGIGMTLQALATKNLAKILAEPNLLVKSGQKGEFLAGSKIPYTIIQSTGGTSTSTIQFIDVGVKLNFKPVVQENGMIALEINPAEVSTTQGTLQINGYPIIDTRSIATYAELKDGESLVLAGLLTEQETKTMSKIPWLGDIPILGALFRTTEKDMEEKELVFFITPKIAQPMASGTKYEFPTDRVTPEQEKDLRWVPMGK